MFARNGRWYYKFTPPGQSKPRYVALRIPGQKFATPIVGLAIPLAWKIYRQHFGDVPSATAADLVARFATQQQPRVCLVYARKQERVLRRFVEEARVGVADDITGPAIRSYLASLGALSPKTISNHRSHIGRFCRWLVREGLLLSNPIHQTDPPVMKRIEIVYLTREECDQAIAIAKELQIYPVLWAIYAGLRLSEIVNLRWSDIRDGPAGKILVVGAVDVAKGGRPASIPLHPVLGKLLPEMPREHPEFVFAERRARVYAERILLPLKRAIPKLARKGQGWPTLRRTFGSLLIQSGCRLEVVSKLMRHADVAITARHYAHLTAEAGREDLGRL